MELIGDPIRVPVKGEGVIAARAHHPSGGVGGRERGVVEEGLTGHRFGGSRGAGDGVA